MAGRTRIISPAARLRHNSLVKGFLRGDRGWLVVGVAMWGPFLVRKALGRSVEIVTTEVLKPGQAVRIEAIRPPSKGERRSRRAR